MSMNLTPKEDGNTVNIMPLVEVFEQYKPPLIVKVFGDLVTLNFKSLFNRS
jgi:hypothetical protein